MKIKSYIFITNLCFFTLFLLSCDGSRIASVEQEELSAMQANTINAVQEPSQITSIEDTANLLEIIEEIKKLSREELLALPGDELQRLGEPLRQVSDGTILLNENMLKGLDNLLSDISQRIENLTKKDHQDLSRQVATLLNPGSGYTHARRNFTDDVIKEMIFTIHESDELDAVAGQLFNTTSSCVLLMPGDNFNTANSLFPSGTTFCVASGTHYQQVSNPKNGNHWFGFTGAVMHGINIGDYAFTGTMVNNTFQYIEIRNYRFYGINSNSGNTVTIQYMTFRNIAMNRNGQTYGAVRFNYSVNINVNNSHFESVASAIRFINSNGPLLVTFNTALNPGRNFFQCNNCNGSAIRINHNSMEHTQQVASQPLEDFINIFQSSGLSSNWIQVNHNRARTDGMGNGINPESSCFIILGDFGGSFQEAKNNIGVNPAQCGIGAASGNNIRVQDNKMYSKLIVGISNVAFYSWKNPPEAPSCSSHTFEGNIANWVCGKPDCNYGEHNKAWSDGSCGLSQPTIFNNTDENLNMGPEIWYMW